ncbi:Uncharacterized membrane protein [Mesonia phycicola]|uniref:Uncharacterized membrane protein n=1 Tax=Mesonia phycicola TaxID=579105 RepID=A0A1M6DQN1_9FLAO|nr:hypothetical protein [Mesonia phycicola]SHI75483.1 Uncharacterized membrane protein [Mesonia phycicola]
MTTSEEIKHGKSNAIVAYFTIIGCIIAIFMNMESKNKFASFHIKQALGIHILYFLLLALVSGFNSWLITFSFWLFVFILWVYGFIGALQGRKTIIPLVGEYFQKWFNKLA